MKKLLLVNPVGQTSGYLLSKFSSIPPLSLAYVAAVTPSDWEVKIADENFDPILFEDADFSLWMGLCMGGECSFKERAASGQH